MGGEGDLRTGLVFGRDGSVVRWLEAVMERVLFRNRWVRVAEVEVLRVLSGGRTKVARAGREEKVASVRRTREKRSSVRVGITEMRLAGSRLDALALNPLSGAAVTMEDMYHGQCSTVVKEAGAVLIL